jgi:hypothetical protein
LQCLESSRRSRGLIVVRKPDRKLSLVERIDLWVSTSRVVDGLWVGTWEAEPHPALRRVEEALQLIKGHDALHYSRIMRNLDRVWVQLHPSALAHYNRSLNACVFDERFVLAETTTLQKIASTIIHEATHARLEGWGIDYHEANRYRIEAICIRRELNFLTKLPDSEHLQEEIAYALEWYAAKQDYFSDRNDRERDNQGAPETFRYLGAPDWFIKFAMWFVRRTTGTRFRMR